MKYRNLSNNLGNGYLQAMVIINKHVKMLANIPPRNHLKQDCSGELIIHFQHMRCSLELL